MVVRQRVIAQLRNVAEELASGVADGLGIATLPEPLSLLGKRPKAEVDRSDFLSLLVRPGSLGIRSRKVAVVVADGIDGLAALRIHQGLVGQGAIPRFVGIKLGAVQSATGDPIDVEVTLEAAPSVLWDASVFVDGQEATDTLTQSGHALEFLKDQYRHAKPILLMGSANALLDEVKISAALPDGAADPALVQLASEDLDVALTPFISALTNHRMFE